jgi:hypothetical protein
MQILEASRKSLGEPAAGISASDCLRRARALALLVQKYKY